MQLLCERIRTVVLCIWGQQSATTIGFCPRFGNCKYAMRLRSALEDFEANTLAAITGLFGKLRYLGTLHDGEGTYNHWGLQKVHGKDAAHVAINTSHRSVLSRILKTPLAVLLEEIGASSESRRIAALELLSALKSPQTLPKSPPPASQSHFKSVLHALSALAESRNTANPRNA